MRVQMEVLAALLIATRCVGSEQAGQAERFEEDLLVRPLPDGNVMTHLTMRTWTRGGGMQHYGMFPKVIGEMVDTYGVGEVHVTMSRGQWIGKRWGSAPVAAPQGVELLAWFAPASPGAPRRSGSELKVAWRGLTNALAGLLGASLNFLASDTQYVHPKHSARPSSGVLRARRSQNESAIAPESHVFLGSLPLEVACTENLSPWGKLLPCRQRAGLSSLLRAERACRGLFSTYSMHVTQECEGGVPASGTCSSDALQLLLVQTATVVERPGAWPMGKEAERVAKGAKAMFSLSSMLRDTSAQGDTPSALQWVTRCPLASASWVHVHIGNDWHEHRTIALNVSRPPLHTNVSRPALHSSLPEVRRQLGGRQGTLVSYDLGSHQTSGLDVTIRWAVFEAASLSVGEGASVVTARRVVASGGLPAKHAGLDGTLVLEIKNEHPSLSVSVWVLDRLPWFVRILSHTLRVESRQDSHHSQQSPDIRNLSLKHLQDAVFDLPQQRQGMSLLEYRVDVAPQASVRVLVDMRKALLHLDDFPPDANRGFDLPAPRLSFVPPLDMTDLTQQRPPVHLAGCSSLLPHSLSLHAQCAHQGLAYTCEQGSRGRGRIHQDTQGGTRHQDTQAVRCHCLDEGLSQVCASPSHRLCLCKLKARGVASFVLFPGNVGLDWPVMVRAGVSERLWSSRHHNRDGREGLVVEFGESVLLQSPAPDFSMPYNVITLTSTVLALFFGSIFNLVTRSLRPLKPEPCPTSRFFGLLPAKP